MRLDKFLKVSRLIKRRTIANTLCQAGKIECNGRIAKASYEVKLGDQIAINMGAKTITVEVLNCPEKITPSIDPLSLYTLLSETYNGNSDPESQENFN